MDSSPILLFRNRRMELLYRSLKRVQQRVHAQILFYGTQAKIPSLFTSFLKTDLQRCANNADKKFLKSEQQILTGLSCSNTK